MKNTGTYSQITLIITCIQLQILFLKGAVGNGGYLYPVPTTAFDYPNLNTGDYRHSRILTTYRPSSYSPREDKEYVTVTNRVVIDERPERFRPPPEDIREERERPSERFKPRFEDNREDRFITRRVRPTQRNRKLTPSRRLTLHEEVIKRERELDQTSKERVDRPPSRVVKEERYQIEERVSTRPRQPERPRNERLSEKTRFNDFEPPRTRQRVVIEERQPEIVEVVRNRPRQSEEVQRNEPPIPERTRFTDFEPPRTRQRVVIEERQPEIIEVVRQPQVQREVFRQPEVQGQREVVRQQEREQPRRFESNDGQGQREEQFRPQDPNRGDRESTFIERRPVTRREEITRLQVLNEGPERVNGRSVENTSQRVGGGRIVSDRGLPREEIVRVRESQSGGSSRGGVEDYVDDRAEQEIFIRNNDGTSRRLTRAEINTIIQQRAGASRRTRESLNENTISLLPGGSFSSAASASTYSVARDYPSQSTSSIATTPPTLSNEAVISQTAAEPNETNSAERTVRQSNEKDSVGISALVPKPIRSKDFPSALTNTVETLLTITPEEVAVLTKSTPFFTSSKNSQISE